MLMNDLITEIRLLLGIRRINMYGILGFHVRHRNVANHSHQCRVPFALHLHALHSTIHSTT